MLCSSCHAHAISTCEKGRHWEEALCLLQDYLQEHLGPRLPMISSLWLVLNSPNGIQTSLCETRLDRCAGLALLISPIRSICEMGLQQNLATADDLQTAC